MKSEILKYFEAWVLCCCSGSYKPLQIFHSTTLCSPCLSESTF